jgi:hypothetical protein
MDRAYTRSVARCWECERLTGEPVTILLVATARRAVELPLCRGCYEECYLPLRSGRAGHLLLDVTG